jgi:hypothetical protein
MFNHSDRSHAAAFDRNVPSVVTRKKEGYAATLIIAFMILLVLNRCL